MNSSAANSIALAKRERIQLPTRLPLQTKLGLAHIDFLDGSAVQVDLPGIEYYDVRFDAVIKFRHYPSGWSVETTEFTRNPFPDAHRRSLNDVPPRTSQWVIRAVMEPLLKWLLHHPEQLIQAQQIVLNNRIVDTREALLESNRTFRKQLKELNHLLEVEKSLGS